MVTTPYACKILEWDDKPQTNKKQTKNKQSMCTYASFFIKTKGFILNWNLNLKLLFLFDFYLWIDCCIWLRFFCLYFRQPYVLKLVLRFSRYINHWSVFGLLISKGSLRVSLATMILVCIFISRNYIAEILQIRRKTPINQSNFFYLYSEVTTFITIHTV